MNDVKGRVSKLDRLSGMVFEAADHFEVEGKAWALAWTVIGNITNALVLLYIIQNHDGQTWCTAF